MADTQDMNEPSSRSTESPSLNATDMRQVMHGNESTSRISVGGHETSITVANYTDARQISFITHEKLNMRSLDSLMVTVKSGVPVKHYFDQPALDQIKINLGVMHAKDAAFSVTINDDAPTVVQAMRQYYSKDRMLRTVLQQAKELYYEPKDHHKTLQIEHDAPARAYEKQLIELAARTKEENVSPENVTKIIKALTENLGKSSTGGNVQAAATIARKMHESLKTADAPTTVEEFQIKFNIFRLDSIASIKEVQEQGRLKAPLRDPHFNNNNKRDRGNSSHNNNNNNNNNKRGRGLSHRGGHHRNHYEYEARSKCLGCNRHHNIEDCELHAHPDRNDSQLPFEKSEKGQQWIAQGHYVLPFSKKLDGTVWADAPQPPRGNNHPPRGGSGGGRHQGGRTNFHRKFNEVEIYDKNEKRIRNDNYEELNATNKISKTEDLAPMYVSIQVVDVAAEAEEEDDKSLILVHTLFDSGATTGNFINRDIAEQLEQRGAQANVNNKIVCSALVGNNPLCAPSLGTINCTIQYKDENNNTNTNNISATIIDSSYDMILGRQTIKKLHLVDKFPSHFKEIDNDEQNDNNNIMYTGNEETKFGTNNHSCPLGCECPKPDEVELLNVLKHKDDIKTIERMTLSPDDKDDDGIDDDDLAVFPFETFLDKSGTELPHCRNENDPAFNQQIHNLCAEYKHIFSKTIRSEPADITPMTIEVDEQAWYNTGRAQLPARFVNAQKEPTLREHVKMLYDNKIIIESNAELYSQLHMIPKPNRTPKEWRVTCDYRDLNSATKPQSNALPNIEQMFSRINSAKPKYFGTLDLTHGYWQVGLAAESMKYTAFICCLGLYMFTRVAMGLRNASGHFQQRLVYEVLMGLIWLICELYIDDLIVHAKTKEDFLRNLRNIFERFSNKGLLMNPAKCYLGMETAEFVGKQIDNEGISFSAKKLSGVELFPLPKSANDVKKFIGLVNYFRDHIPHTTEIVAPLLALIPDYDKRKHRRLQWRELDDNRVERMTGDILEHMRPAYEAFERAKKAIIDCPKLYFFQYDRDTILCTDASDIGAGGYLYQVDKEGREYPIAFASKSFSKQQRRWATPDKEAFAIYYCVKKFSHYLRDIHFTIKTDHKNLLYIDKDPDAKIRRYKLALQEYDCDWEYINTHDNIVADDMSRLCPSVPSEISEQFPIEEREWLNALIDEFEIPQKVINFLSQIHNSQVGHLGVEKTIRRVEKIFEDYDAYYTEDIDGESHEQANIRMMQEIESTLEKHPADKRYRTIRKDIKRREKKFTQALEELRADEEINLDPASIRRYVKKFIRQCPCCQKMSQIKIPIHTIPFTTASYFPMERLNIDTIGPLKEDEDGNTYLIAIIDCFSRWVGLYPVKDVTATEAVKALLDHFAIFGCPTQLLSDNGSQFINQLIDEFMKLISTEHITTLAYSKEENAIVERVNKESMRHIRNLIFEYKDTNKWRNFSKMVMRILNATVHESIGVSPSQILFGNAIDLDRGLLMPLETPNSDLSTALSEWSAAMLNMQSKLIKDAQDTQRKRDERNIARRTQEEPTEFAINSYVLVGYPKTAHNPGPPTKFHARLKGPMQVVNKQGNTYTLRNLVSNQTKNYHITALRQFIYDPAIVDPRVVAMSDDQYFEVERIKAHRGTFNHKKELRFHVKWVGYPDDEENNTWLLWKDLRNNIALHNYLRNNNLQKHIPQPFQ